MRRICVASAIALFALHAAAAEVAVAHWTDHGTANTPTAGGALSIDADVTITKDDDGHLFLNTSISTSNGALTDNGTGCVKLTLLSNGTPTSTFKVCSPQNPGKGLPFNGNTVRSGGRKDQVPSGVQFDQIGFAFYNSEHDGEPIDLGKILAVGASLLAL